MQTCPILLEKDRLLGLKICAGFLEPRIFEEFEINPRIVDCYIDRFLFHTRSNHAALKSSYLFGYGKGATVQRRKFDSWLANKAVEAGAKLQTSSRCLRAIIRGGKVRGIEVATGESEKRLQARIIVAADGFYSKIARSVGLVPTYGKRDFKVCFQKEVYLETPPVDGEIHVFFGNEISRCGYGWLFPKKHGYTAGVSSLAAHLTNAKALSKNLDWLLKEHPVCSDLVRSATNISEPELGYIPVSQHPALSCNGLAMVGDAAGQVSPTTGGGIYYAMKAAEIASDVIIKSLEIDDNSVESLQKYDSTWKATLGRDLHFERLLFDMSRIHYTGWQELMLLINKSLISSTLVGFGLFCLKTLLPYF